MKELLLSVIMPNYNHAQFLEKRISSILFAMPQDAELIIIDDASTDESVSIINRFAQEDTRIRFYINPQNLGVDKSYNRLLSMAKGKYLSILAADDDLLPTFFSKTVSVLEQHPEVGLCCSIAAHRCYHGSEKNQSDIIALPLIEGIHQATVFSADRIVEIFKRTDFWVATHTTILRRKLLDEYGVLDERLGPYCDWLLMHIIALKEGVVYLPETLSIWVEHQTNYSKLNKKRKHIYVRALLDKINGELKILKPSFRRSTILRIYLKPCLLWLIFHPQYWDYLMPVIIRYFRKCLKKSVTKIKINHL